MSHPLWAKLLKIIKKSLREVRSRDNNNVCPRFGSDGHVTPFLNVGWKGTRTVFVLRNAPVADRLNGRPHTRHTPLYETEEKSHCHWQCETEKGSGWAGVEKLERTHACVLMCSLLPWIETDVQSRSTRVRHYYLNSIDHQLRYYVEKNKLVLISTDSCTL